MMPRLIRIGACCGLAILFGVGALAPLSASAHEHREIADDTYAVEVGFLEEPAIVGEKNGLYLNVVKSPESVKDTEGHDGSGEPVEDLADTLDAEVIYGDQTRELILVAVLDKPGVYTAMFFPMAEGDYTFRIFGRIEGMPIDEFFTSSPEGFDAVESREPYEVPKQERSLRAIFSSLG